LNFSRELILKSYSELSADMALERETDARAVGERNFEIDTKAGEHGKRRIYLLVFFRRIASWDTGWLEKPCSELDIVC